MRALAIVALFTTTASANPIDLELGMLGSVGIDQPFHRSPYTNGFTREIAVYATYAFATLAEWNREPFGARRRWLRDGRYHWLDIGITMRAERGRYFIGVGGGIAMLLAHPDPIGESIEDDDEKLLGRFTPSGVIRDEGWGPVLWSSIGVTFF